MPLNSIALTGADEVFEKEIGHAFEELRTDIASSPANAEGNLSKAENAILKAHLEWRQIHAMIQGTQPPTATLGSVGEIPVEDSKLIAAGIDATAQGAVSKATEDYGPSQEFVNALANIKAAYTAMTGILSH